jgi:arylsulfatase A-like enzyme
MHGSHGVWRKQPPYDEAVRVPFLLRWPAGLGRQGREVTIPVSAPDLVPTLLGLCGVDVPKTVEGTDLSRVLLGEEETDHDAGLIAAYAPFGEWPKSRGGREYRGVRTSRYTYVKTLDGPWLLFDNEEDPYQQRNLANTPAAADLQAELEAVLSRLLAQTGDRFEPAEAYIQRWGYPVDANGTVPYTP